jgi:hypothetical protein
MLERRPRTVLESYFFQISKGACCCDRLSVVCLPVSFLFCVSFLNLFFWLDSKSDAVSQSGGCW